MVNLTYEGLGNALHTLSETDRDDLTERLEADGFAVLPGRLPEALSERVLAAIDRIAAEERATAGGQEARSVKRHNCVALDRAFRELMMWEPALQMAHDQLGPSFHLNQSNFISRVAEPAEAGNFAASIGWHADGPRPGQFPRIDGRMGLHYLKFGFFLTDLTHGSGGSLEVVRGSHRRPELDGRGRDFEIGDYRRDHVRFDCPAGTVVAFSQALWHAAPPNRSDRERKNVYISYCPTWMKPLDYDLPRAGELADDLTSEERWLLGEYRPPLRFWLPSGEDKQRLAAYARPGR